jgi:hypothetical protein
LLRGEQAAMVWTMRPARTRHPTRVDPCQLTERAHCAERDSELTVKSPRLVVPTNLHAETVDGIVKLPADGCNRLDVSSSVCRVSAFHLSPYHLLRQVRASPHSNDPASSTSTLTFAACKHRDTPTSRVCTSGVTYSHSSWKD